MEREKKKTMGEYYQRLNLCTLAISATVAKSEFRKSQVIKELLINRELSLDALKFYYFFLEGYLNQSSSSKYQKAFYTMTNVCKLIVKPQAAAIKVKTGKVFLSTQTNKLVDVFHELQKKGILVKDNEPAERQLFIPKQSSKRKKKSAGKKTIQPAKIKFNNPTLMFMPYDYLSPSDIRDALKELLLAAAGTAEKKEPVNHWAQRIHLKEIYLDRKPIEEIRKEVQTSLDAIGIRSHELLHLIDEKETKEHFKEMRLAKRAPVTNFWDFKEEVREGLKQMEEEARKAAQEVKL